MEPSTPDRKYIISVEKHTVEDAVAKQAAGEILDQIQDSPGQITLNFTSPETTNLCPLPSEFDDTEDVDEILTSVREGQLTMLLQQPARKFKPIRPFKIRGAAVDRPIPAREMGMEEALEKLKRGEKWLDEYVGFGAAVANILRRLDVETAERVAQSIATTIENEAVIAMN